MEVVTTYLEMRSKEQLRARRAADARFQVREWAIRDGQFNRELYLSVGEPWHWTDKRAWTDAQWAAYAQAPGLRTFAAYLEANLAGYYELRSDGEGGVEIAYFGLLANYIGRGLGGALLTSAIENAWESSPPPDRVWVHTCTHDHPGALANYEARGLVIYRREAEPDRA